MNSLRQLARGGWPMLANLSLTLVLLMSLLSAGQVWTVAMPAKMQAGGGCAGMNCERGCCADMACCRVMEENKTPPATLGIKPQGPAQAVAPEPKVHVILASLEPRPRPFVLRDEPSAQRRVSPLVASGIWLI